MRVTTWALVAFVALCTSFASAAPKRRPHAPAPAGQSAADKADQELMTKLQTELGTLQAKQAYIPAIKIAKQLVDLQIKISGKDDDRVGYKLQALAGLYSSAGDYAQARKIYQELLDAAVKKHGAESQEVLMQLTMLTSTMWAQNRMTELDQLHKRMLDIEKKLHGEQSIEYARQLQSYAVVLDQRNEYTAAQRMYEQALSISEAVLPKNDYQLVSSMQVLASNYWQTNQQPKAIALYDKAIKTVEQAPNTTPLMVGATIYGVASMYHYGKRDDLAVPLIKKVVALYDAEIAKLEKTKPDDYQISSMLGMESYMLQQMNDLAGAERVVLKAMALDEKRPGYNGYSGYTGSLAEIKHAQGKTKEAIALYEKAQAQLAKIAPQSTVAYNISIANFLRETGEFKKAEQLMAGYLAWVEKLYGRKHPMYGMAELTMAFAYMGSGEIGKAESVLNDSLEIAERELQNTLKTGTDADHATYFARYGYQLDTAINFNYFVAPKQASVTRLALTTLLRRKGRALDASAASIATIRAKLSPEDKQLLDDLASARNRLAKLTVAGPTATGDADAYSKEVAALEDQVEKLELQLGQKSAAYRAVSTKIDLASIQKLIPRDAKLVEIVNWQPGDVRKPYDPKRAVPPRRYAAYVVGATGEPVLVDLAPAPDIDDAVAKFRKAVSDPDNDRAAELGKALYELTIGKLAGQLGSATEIFIAPDGTLNVVPFSALVDGKGEFLVKKYTFTYLTSGRDLLRIKARPKALGGGVIFAQPSFDAGKPAPAPAQGGGPASRGRRSADLASLEWPPLPGTGQEAKAVAATMKGLKVFTGDAATETAVKGLHSPRILHLATHGFFLPDEAKPPSNDNRGAGGAGPAIPPGMPNPAASGPPQEENPLLRSGLAFAGANKLTSGDDDGILTALEASGLDLEGTKLVVLSACETGVGKVTNGDGVYGLRRALVIAGAESLVMSLWQVDDQATKDLMVGYYKRLAKGESRSSALREIQLELQAGKYKHPYYWASFLPAGDNSPIKE